MGAWAAISEAHRLIGTFRIAASALVTGSDLDTARDSDQQPLIKNPL